MRLGAPVPGIFFGDWRFVAEDMHDISQRVRVLDPDARLAMNVENERLAIVRHVRLDVNHDLLGTNPHDTWIIALMLIDPHTGEPHTGEPHAQVLDLMRIADSWRRRNPTSFRAMAEAQAAKREERDRKRDQERARQFAEEYLMAGRKLYGLKPNIYVPSDLPKAG